MLTYAVIGTGAVGGYYGALLQRAGAETYFLARSDAKYIAKNGLRIQSRDGDFALRRVKVRDRPELMPRCDVALIALKTTNNAALGNILPHVLKPDGVAVAMQNGLGEEEKIASIVAPRAVVGALSFICSNKVGPGQIHHIDYGQVTLAQYGPGGAAAGVTDIMRAIGADLEAAGVPITLDPDLKSARWKKLMWNIPYNGLSVVLDAATNDIMANPATRALSIDLMRETLAGARACGATIGDDHVQKMIDHTDNMQPYRTSMKLDWDEGRPMEFEAIYGAPLAAARAAGFEMWRVGMLYEQLRFLEGRPKLVCPRCHQDWIFKIRHKETGNTLLVCPECEASWADGEKIEVRDDTFQDASSRLRSRGEEFRWSDYDSGLVLRTTSG